MSAAPKHVVVTGAGHLGRRVCDELLRRGAEVTLVVDEIGATARLDAEGHGLRVVEGEAVADEVLDRLALDAACCLVVAGEDDHENLEIGLAARRRRPDLRVVISLFDEGLGHGVERAVGFEVLSSAFLSAPAFVSAATDEALLAAFDIDGVTLALFGDEDHARRGALEPPLTIVRSGDRLSVAGGASPGAACDGRLWASVRGVAGGREAKSGRPSPSEPGSGNGAPRAAGGGPGVAYGRLTGRRPRRAPLRTLGEGLRRLALFPLALWRHAGPTVKALLVASLTLMIVSVIVFTLFMELDPLDAFYFVITTVTTTGYGDINLIETGWALKLYGTLMMFFGAGALAIAFALIADFFITARIETLLGRRAVDLDGHVVVAGLGRVGYRVAQALRALGETVVAIDLDGDAGNVAAARRQMPVVVGDAARTAVLSQAAVGRARALIAATDDAMRNVAIALQAKEGNAALVTVVRAFETDTASRLGDLGFDALLSTSAIAAPMFADAALRREVLASFMWDDRDVLVVRWAATGDAEAAGVAPVLVSGGHGAAPRLARPGEPPGDERSLVVLALRDGPGGGEDGAAAQDSSGRSQPG